MRGFTIFDLFYVLLSHEHCKSKKSLGQHFLKDQNIARKIIDSLLPVTAEVLEIGPGMGVLTRHLLEQGIFAVKAIDIDQESIAYLHNEFPSYHDRIIFGDFLKTDLSAWYSAPLSVIGNLPYNISSQIFFVSSKTTSLSGRSFV